MGGGGTGLYSRMLCYEYMSSVGTQDAVAILALEVFPFAFGVAGT